jgi:5'-3' exonuclease
MADRAPPPFLNDPSALVIVDWSWWLNKAFALDGSDGMTSCVVGWLTALLAYHPAHVCIALDAPGLTFRHRMEHPTDSSWRYKAHRDPKPDDFYLLSRRCTELAELHGIPALWADGFEADDVIATVVRKARAAGYRIWICSADKDLAGLVEDDAAYGILVGLWDNAEATVRGPQQVFDKLGIWPAQVADMLAIAGDAGDNVPGVPGLGRGRAAALLEKFVTLENALATTPADVADLSAQIKSTKKESQKAANGEREQIAAIGQRLLKERQIAKYHQALIEHAEVARFSRLLTALDCDAPLDVPWEELPTGGFHASALRAKYESLGYTRKAAQVPEFRKRPPWAIGL